MITFIGEYSCRVDAKGRIMLPSAFKKQMPMASSDRFVIKRDVFEPCLVLFPMQEWERQNKIIRRNTNPYNREHNRFLRMFYHGTADILLDASNRILIPRRLIEYAAIGEEVILAGQFGKIEIWANDKYERISEEVKDFASLAEGILGGAINELDNDVVS